jgi:hypothetical protein
LDDVGQRIVTGTVSLMTGALTRTLLTGKNFSQSVMEALPDAIANTVGELIAGKTLASTKTAKQKHAVDLLSAEELESKYHNDPKIVMEMHELEYNAVEINNPGGGKLFTALVLGGLSPEKAVDIASRRSLTEANSGIIKKNDSQSAESEILDKKRHSVVSLSRGDMPLGDATLYYAGMAKQDILQIMEDYHIEEAALIIGIVLAPGATIVDLVREKVIDLAVGDMLEDAKNAVATQIMSLVLGIGTEEINADLNRDPNDYLDTEQNKQNIADLKNTREKQHDGVTVIMAMAAMLPGLKFLKSRSKGVGGTDTPKTDIDVAPDNLNNRIDSHSHHRTEDRGDRRTDRDWDGYLDNLSNPEIRDRMSGMVSDIRAGLQKDLPSRLKDKKGFKNGNIGYAEIDIDFPGLPATMKAHSKFNDRDGWAPLPSGENAIFAPTWVDKNGKVVDPGTPDSWLRDVDTEYKILESVAQTLGDNHAAKGKINLFTERAPCASCNPIINQFRERYPNVQLNVFWDQGS